MNRENENNTGIDAYSFDRANSILNSSESTYEEREWAKSIIDLADAYTRPYNQMGVMDSYGNQYAPANMKGAPTENNSIFNELPKVEDTRQKDIIYIYRYGDDKYVNRDELYRFGIKPTSDPITIDGEEVCLITEGQERRFLMSVEQDPDRKIDVRYYNLLINPAPIPDPDPIEIEPKEENVVYIYRDGNNRYVNRNDLYRYGIKPTGDPIIIDGEEAYLIDDGIERQLLMRTAQEPDRNIDVQYERIEHHNYIRNETGDGNGSDNNDNSDDGNDLGDDNNSNDGNDSGDDDNSDDGNDSGDDDNSDDGNDSGDDDNSDDGNDSENDDNSDDGNDSDNDDNSDDGNDSDNDDNEEMTDDKDHLDDNGTADDNDSDNDNGSNDTETNDDIENYYDLTPFTIDYDGLTTITIEDLDIPRNIEQSVLEATDRIKQLEQEQERRRKNGNVNSLSDDELVARLNEILDEIQYRTHSENGLEEHENDSLLEEYKIIKEEVEWRKKENKLSLNPVRCLTDSELDAAIQEQRDIIESLRSIGTEYRKLEDVMPKYEAAVAEQEARKRGERTQGEFSTLSDEELNSFISNANRMIESIDDNGKGPVYIYRDGENKYVHRDELYRFGIKPQGEPIVINDEELYQISDGVERQLVMRTAQDPDRTKTEYINIPSIKIPSNTDDMDIRKVFINGDRTNNLTVGPKSEGFALSNGDYVSLQEVAEAIDNEFMRLGENEVVVCTRTGKKVNKEEILNAIIEASKQDSRIQIAEQDENLPYTNHGILLNDRRDLTDAFVPKGNLKVPKDDIPEDYFIRSNIVKEVLKNYKKGKEKEVGPPVVEPVEIDPKEEERLVRDMLDRFYGNRKREKLYRKSMKLYKSHIVRDANGFLTVEDFPERELIEREFHLEEYKDRIEAYSRYEQGDTSRYKQLLANYEAIGYEFPKKANGEDYSKEEKIAILAKEDAHYIETFNGNYNSYANTYLNLKTLGKDGEKKPLLKIEKLRDNNGNFKLRRIFTNAYKIGANAYIALQNVVKALPNRLIGTYVVAPIQKLLHNSEKKAAGSYTNKQTHRYAARKDYYEKLMQQKLAEKYAKEGRSLDEIKLWDALKCTFGARIKAITHWREGNAKVLDIGYANIKLSLQEKAHIETLQQQKLAEIQAEVDKLESSKQKINTALQNASQEEKAKLEEELKSIDQRLNELANTRKVIEESPIRGFRTNATDAVSQEVHDKANKSNITHTVHGVKLVGRVLAANYLYPKIMEKITTTKTVVTPGTTKTVKTTNYDPSKIENLTLEDLKLSGDQSVLHYDALGRVNKDVPFKDGFYRGVHFKLGDKYYSGTDGIGYAIHNPAGYSISNTGIGQLTGQTRLCDVVAETYRNVTGQVISPSAIAQEIAKDPQGFLSDFDIWLSFKDNGIATGWQNGFNLSALGDLFKYKTVVTPGVTHTISDTVNKLNIKAIAALAAMGVGQASDLYDALRRTNSQEENIALGASEKNISEVPEEQATDKAPRRPTITDAPSEWGFTGRKRADLATRYNEAGMADEIAEEFLRPEVDEMGRGR